MKKLIIALCIICLGNLHVDAQKEETVFGIGGVKLTGIWGGSSNGLVRLGNDFSQNNGGFFTFEINDNLLLGWSGYGSGSTLEDGRHVDLDGNDLLVGYGFDSYKVVHPFIYLKTGSSTLQVAEAAKDNVFVFQPTIGGEVNIFRWFRVGIDAGYRFVSGVNTAGLSDNDLSSPLVNLKLKFGWSWNNKKDRVDYIEDDY